MDFSSGKKMLNQKKYPNELKSRFLTVGWWRAGDIWISHELKKARISPPPFFDAESSVVSPLCQQFLILGIMVGWRHWHKLPEKTFLEHLRDDRSGRRIWHIYWIFFRIFSKRIWPTWKLFFLTGRTLITLLHFEIIQ